VLTNCEFITYICKKEDQYKEGKDIDTNLLMLQADNKFKIMFKAKTWNAPSPKEEKIFTFGDTNPEAPKGKEKTKQDGGKKGDGKGESKKGKSKKQKQAKWMKVIPANANKDKPKTIKGKEYFWCAKHARWAGHIMSACQGKGLNKEPKTSLEPLPSPQTMAHLGLSRVLFTIVLSDSK